MTNVRYHVSFRARVLYPNGIKTERFSCVVFMNPDVYPNGIRLADMALLHAWRKTVNHFFSTSHYGIPQSIELQDLMEVEKNA